MANALTGNPIRVESAATVWAAGGAPKYVQLIQWLDVAADITDDDDIVLTINGVAITGKVQVTDNTMNNLVAWEMSFSPPIPIESFVVTTIDGGNLIIWLA